MVMKRFCDLCDKEMKGKWIKISEFQERNDNENSRIIKHSVGEICFPCFSRDNLYVVIHDLAKKIGNIWFDPETSFKDYLVELNIN